MPSTLNQVVSLIQSGSAHDVRQALANGFQWPKDATRHPVFDLLEAARHSNAREMPEKLDALIDHGMPVDFTLPFDTNVGATRKELVHLGIMEDRQHRNRHLSTPLLARAAGLGLTDLVDVLLRRGAVDEAAAARRMAALAGKLAALDRLLASTKPDEIRWTHWATALLERKAIDEAGFTLMARYLPAGDDTEQMGTLLHILSDQRFRRGVLAWLNHDPGIWQRLHDTPCPPVKTGVVPSMWPHVLSSHAREQYPLLFENAVAHMQRQPAWKTLPVGYLQAPKWGPRKLDEDYLKSGLMGWGGQLTLLPVLQTLLHGSRRLPRGRAEFRRMAKAARSLKRAGCVMWIGGEEAGQPHTEQTLWAAADLRPSKRWLLRHQLFLKPHVQTGITPLHVVRTTLGADHWIECGLDVGAVDAQGNQALALFVPLAAKTASQPPVSVSKATEWAQWLKSGWKRRGFPSQGSAWDASIVELACCNTAVFSSLPAKARKSLPKNGQGLHWASMFGNAKIVERLLDMGHDPAAVDANGRTPLACLVMGMGAAGGGGEEKAFSRCVDLAILTHWPETVDLDGKNALQRLMESSCGKEAVSGNRNGKAIDRLLRHLVQRRVDQPCLWSAGDTSSVIEALREQSNMAVYTRFVQTIPSVAQDDLLLALHDPARWPANIRQSGLDFAVKMVATLVKLGANYEATSLVGHRLIDGWHRLEAWERSMTEGSNIRPSALLSQGEARTVMEHQRLSLDTGGQQSPAEAGVRKMRL